MRTGRPTTDKKDNTAKVRLNDEMTDYLENTAKRKGMSVSEVIRECIRNEMRTSRF